MPANSANRPNAGQSERLVLDVPLFTDMLDVLDEAASMPPDATLQDCAHLQHFG